MTLRTLLAAIFQNETVNFLLTNRIPRQLLTRFMGKFSKIEQPWIRDLSLAFWSLFSQLDLADAKKSKFKSVHDCFTRELKEGARPIDLRPEILVSPCDAIIGACGSLSGIQALQAKDSSYPLQELLDDPSLAEHYRDGAYATLRLTSAMYHRFHAPYNGAVHHVSYISGDAWNVNPAALKRVRRLFCKNERAVIQFTLSPQAHLITLVPVAAVLVASMRFHFLDVLFHLRHQGPNRIPCRAPFAKGDEMGWFEHGSTILVFAPKGFNLAGSVQPGRRIRMGQPLLTTPGIA